MATYHEVSRRNKYQQKRGVGGGVGGQQEMKQERVTRDSEHVTRTTSKPLLAKTDTTNLGEITYSIRAAFQMRVAGVMLKDVHEDLSR